MCSSTIDSIWTEFIKKLRDDINFSLQKRVNKRFEVMFETGVDEMAWDDTVSHLVVDSMD